MKKPLLVLGAVAGVSLAGLTGLGVAQAASSSPHDSIIERIATKFNLDKDEVEAVFEEEHAARHAEMQQKMEERLDKAVADGKLTEDQKAKILAKLQELKEGRELWKDKTPEERKELRLSLHEDLKQWAEDNNIPLEYLHIKLHHHGGPGKHFMLHH